MNRLFVFLLLLWGLGACLGARSPASSDPALNVPLDVVPVTAAGPAPTAEPDPPPASAMAVTQQFEPTPPKKTDRLGAATKVVSQQPEAGLGQLPTPTPHPTKETQLVASFNLAPAPPTAVPPPATMIDRDPYITVYALLGNDHAGSRNGRTDSMILAALNPQAKSVTLLSLPRDLYVVMPGWTMGRLNLAYAHGGADLFRETVAYNLGLPVDHTIRVGFEGFEGIVDALGGIEVVVNCPVEDWRLKAPDLDPQVKSSWERYELDFGIQPMDGDLALWYARSRLNSNDFDRGRRQQKILHALWQKARLSPEILERLPELVRALWTAVQTDLSLSQALALASSIPQWRDYSVNHLILPQEALRPWLVPGSGEAVQLLDYQRAELARQSLLTEPALRSANKANIRVVVVSEDYILYRQAAENLSWYGFEPIHEAPNGEAPQETTITYFGPTLKGAYPDRLAWILRQETADIQLQPQPADDTPYYHVHLAPDYNPCLSYFSNPGG